MHFMAGAQFVIKLRCSQAIHLNHHTMKKTIVFLSVLAMVFTFQQTEAQSIRSMIRKKVIEDNLEAQAKRDSVRAVEAGEEPDKSPNTTMNHVYLDALGLSDNVPYESNYDFDAYMRIELSEFNKNEKLKESNVYDTHLHKASADYAMIFKENDDRTTIIFDTKNSAMLILTDSDGEHTGMAMGIDPETMKEEVEASAEESDISTYKPYKTGKTKTILGYSCDEYLVDEETSEAHMWVSEKLGREVKREMLKNQQTFGTMFYYAAYLDGMVMEYDQLDKESGERTVMQITEIDLNRSHSISTRSYAVLTMKVKTPETEEEEE